MWQSLTLNFVENLFLDSFISHQPLRTNHSLHEIRTLALGAPCDVAHVWSSVSHLPLRLPHLAFPASGSLGSAPSPTHPLPPEASGARSLPGADRCGRRTSRCAFLSPCGFVPFFPSPSPPAFSLASRGEGRPLAVPPFSPVSPQRWHGRGAPKAVPSTRSHPRSVGA